MDPPSLQNKWSKAVCPTTFVSVLPRVPADLGGFHCHAIVPFIVLICQRRHLATPSNEKRLSKRKTRVFFLVSFLAVPSDATDQYFPVITKCL